MAYNSEDTGQGMATVDLGSPDCRSGFGFHLGSIADALNDLMDRRLAARRRHKLAVAAAHDELVERMRQADRVFECRAGEAARVRIRALESDPLDPDVGLEADSAYFEAVGAAERIHCEHRQIIAAAKDAADAAASSERDRDYHAATAWFLGVVQREIEDAVREVISSRGGV